MLLLLALSTLGESVQGQSLQEDLAKIRRAAPLQAQRAVTRALGAFGAPLPEEDRAAVVVALRERLQREAGALGMGALPAPDAGLSIVLMDGLLRCDPDGDGDLITGVVGQSGSLFLNFGLVYAMRAPVARWDLLRVIARHPHADELLVETAVSKLAEVAPEVLVYDLVCELALLRVLLAQDGMMAATTRASGGGWGRSSRPYRAGPIPCYRLIRRSGRAPRDAKIMLELQASDGSRSGGGVVIARESFDRYRPEIKTWRSESQASRLLGLPWQRWALRALLPAAREGAFRALDSEEVLGLDEQLPIATDGSVPSLEARLDRLVQERLKLLGELLEGEVAKRVLTPKQRQAYRRVVLRVQDPEGAWREDLHRIAGAEGGLSAALPPRAGLQLGPWVGATLERRLEPSGPEKAAAVPAEMLRWARAALHYEERSLRAGWGAELRAYSRYILQSMALDVLVRAGLDEDAELVQRFATDSRFAHAHGLWGLSFTQGRPKMLAGLARAWLAESTSSRWQRQFAWKLLQQQDRAAALADALEQRATGTLRVVDPEQLSDRPAAGVRGEASWSQFRDVDLTVWVARCTLLTLHIAGVEAAPGQEELLAFESLGLSVVRRPWPPADSEGLWPPAIAAGEPYGPAVREAVAGGWLAWYRAPKEGVLPHSHMRYPRLQVVAMGEVNTLEEAYRAHRERMGEQLDAVVKSLLRAGALSPAQAARLPEVMIQVEDGRVVQKPPLPELDRR